MCISLGVTEIFFFLFASYLIVRESVGLWPQFTSLQIEEPLRDSAEKKALTRIEMAVTKIQKQLPSACFLVDRFFFSGGSQNANAFCPEGLPSLCTCLIVSKIIDMRQ